MKTLKLVSLIALLFMFMAVVRCTDSKTTAPTPLGTLSGAVFYPNSAGTNVAAPGAFVTLLTGASQVMQVVADNTGKFSIPNLAAGDYSLSATFYVLPTNTGGRLDGLNFATASDQVVTMGSSAITQDLTMVNTGQTGTSIEAIDINYAWTGSVYANTGTWTYDGVHSPVAFEFPYRGTEGDFVGGFGQLSKAAIAFDPANPSAGTIDVEVDMLSVNTRTPGGRDPMIQNGANELGTPNSYQFSSLSVISVMGCIGGTFGINLDASTPPVALNTLPSVITNDNADRYAQFKVLAGGITKYGDGYVAKGNLTWRGFTIPTEMWFKVVPKWLDAPAAGNGTTNNRFYSGFEGKFLLDPYTKFNIRSGSVNQAILRIQISVVCYKL